MTTCAKCKTDIGGHDRFALCLMCFIARPKGIDLENYVKSKLPSNPRIKKMPEHFALTIRKPITPLP